MNSAVNSNTGKIPGAFLNKHGWPWDDESVVFAASGTKNFTIPKISIITPSFNQGAFLEETIRSILLQNYPNIELIIIDGGSTDNSVEIIKKYEKYITYWVSEKDKGQSDALNKGLKLVTGNLVGWQNSDDTYTKNAFWEIANAYNKWPGMDVYFGNMQTIDKSSTVLKTHFYAPFSFNEIKYSGWNITNQSCFFSREILQKVGIREDLRYVMDGALYFGVASKTFKFRHIKKVLGCFRLHDDAKSSNMNMTVGWDEWVLLRKEYGITMKNDVPWEKQFKLWKLYFKCRKAFYYLPEIIKGTIHK